MGISLGIGLSITAGYRALGTAPSAPSTFASDDWSLEDAGIGATLHGTIIDLPTLTGFTLTNIQYRIDGGTPNNINQTTAGAEFFLDNLTDDQEYDVEIRPIVAEYNWPDDDTGWSDVKSATPTEDAGATAPAQFGTGDWSAADRNTVDGATITLTVLPDDGGSAITALQYQVDGGSWVSLGGTTTGDYNISGLTWNTSQAIAIRAVNAVGNGTASATKSVTPTGSTEADLVFAAFTTPPTSARAKLIDNYISALKTAGVWSKLDALYVCAAADSQAATINWKAPGSHNLTPNNSPTFTTDRGFTGNGTNANLATGWQPLTNMTQYTQNSAHHSARFLNSVAANGNNRGIGNTTAGGSNALLNPRDVSDVLRMMINDSTSAIGGTVTNTDTRRHFLANRSGSAARQGYVNGTSVATDTVSSVTLSNSSINFLSYNSNYATLQLASGSFGASLTGTEVQDFYNADLAYMQAVGAM